MYFAARVPPRDPGPRPSSRSSARYLTFARNLLSSICEAANSASLDSLSSARFSDIILSNAGRGVVACSRLPRRERLSRSKRLFAAPFFAAPFFAAPFFATPFFATPFFCAGGVARRCIANTLDSSGQTRPKQISKTSRRINGRCFFITPQSEIIPASFKHTIRNYLSETLARLPANAAIIWLVWIRYDCICLFRWNLLGIVYLSGPIKSRRRNLTARRLHPVRAPFAHGFLNVHRIFWARIGAARGADSKPAMTELSWRTRSESLSKFAEEVFDILIIGGGITGAGLALDAAARGLRVSLVEKRDFAAGTSSRSTKLIHGGLRYLEHFDFTLVREGLRERAILAKTAPGLARPFPFVIPIYKNSRRNYDRPLKMRMGLWLYDLLAGRYNFARHRRLSRDEALSLAPQLDPQGLKGAFLYYDAVTNDSRLVIEVIKTARERGAEIANHTRVAGFIRNESGKIAGAHLRDELTGGGIECRARIVINATGVWMEETINLNGQTTNSLNRRMRPAKGVHLTVSADRLRVGAAWLIPSLTSHRFYFVVPWEGRVNIGTTDTDYDGDKDHPRAEPEEVNEILGAINAYFPEGRLDQADVISSWAGLRPLIADPRARGASDVSRKEEIIESENGLISIGRGKLTTYRLMAERGIDLAARRLNERFNIAAGAASAKDEAIGGEISSDELTITPELLSQTENLPLETAQHLLCDYGPDYRRLIELTREDERLRGRLVEGLPQILAEVVYAARYEMALTLADVMARRIRLAMVAGREALNCAATVADAMARELGWSGEQAERQVAQFTAEFEREFAVSASDSLGNHE